MATATVEELQTLAVAKVVDARGAACPGPLLEAKKGMPGVPVGQVIELWSTDPGTKTDVAAWCTKIGHSFLGVVEDAGYDRVFVRRQK
ncbi:MAG: sulfurtransferase TusA family protein [Chloroflexota bacterium]